MASSLAKRLSLRLYGSAPGSSLQTPPPRRLSTPAGQRLSGIVESASSTRSTMTSALPPGTAITSDEAVPPPPPRSHFRLSGLISSSRSVETPPPEYAKYNYNKEAGPPNGVYEGTEKAERLWANHKIAKRGGWGRLIILLIVVVCLGIALGVGLGVGLNKDKKKSSSSDASTSSAAMAAALGFPIGEYSLNTALRTVSTNCTSVASTWRCYPYSIYSGDTTTSSSITTFNWIISNTSALYVSNTSLPTTDEAGIAANLSISSSDNPFSISFTNQSLTYYNNDSHPRYEFQYISSKQVIPTTSLTSGNSASVCFYNSTVLTGSLYLSDTLDVDYPLANSTAGNYQSWPFAVRVAQTADGGDDTPDCYETTNGVVGESITANITYEDSGEECLCGYRNFEL